MGLDQRILNIQSCPTELIIRIFCHLPTFSEVFSLAGTCRHYHQVWTDNVNFIYSIISPKCIPCRRHARNLLEDQGGTHVDCPILTVWDVQRLYRNACVVLKSIDLFNQAAAGHIKTTTKATAIQYYGMPEHPPCLTRTEIHRYVRSYYQLWGLMIIDPIKRNERLKDMLLKDLYMVHEMSLLRQDRVGDETVSSAVQDERLCYDLSNGIWAQIKQSYKDIHGRDAYYISIHAIDGGFESHYILFDHAQEDLRDVIFPRRIADLPRAVWEDSSSDEDGV